MEEDLTKDPFKSRPRLAYSPPVHPSPPSDNNNTHNLGGNKVNNLNDPALPIPRPKYLVTPNMGVESRDNLMENVPPPNDPRWYHPPIIYHHHKLDEDPGNSSRPSQEEKNVSESSDDNKLEAAMKLPPKTNLDGGSLLRM